MQEQVRQTNGLTVVSQVRPAQSARQSWFQPPGVHFNPIPQAFCYVIMYALSRQPWSILLCTAIAGGGAVTLQFRRIVEAI